MFKDVFYRNLQPKTIEKMMKYSSFGFLREIPYNFYARQDFFFLRSKQILGLLLLDCCRAID
jgi:hypothetical protein